jgi:hypothetical protein
MPHPNMEKRRLVAPLENGLSIWKVHIDTIREQDRNARVMALEKFERLSANIEKDQRLESLPLVANRTPADVTTTFSLISGHHRVRAARKAGLQEIFVLNDESDLTFDQIVSKQLAHNALAGYDDQAVLAELYKSIRDVEARIESGITEQEIAVAEVTTRVDDVSFDLTYEMLNILFLTRDFERFGDVLTRLEPEARVYLADKADFDRFKEIARGISRRYDVVNMSAIMAKMIDVVSAHLAREQAEEDGAAAEREALPNAPFVNA